MHITTSLHALMSLNLTGCSRVSRACLVTILANAMPFSEIAHSYTGFKVQNHYVSIFVSASVCVCLSVRLSVCAYECACVSVFV